MSGIVGTSHSKSKVIGSSKDTAKAWGSLWYTGATPTLTNSFNISSITDQGAGHARISFMNPMPNDGYSVAGMGSGTTSGGAILVLSQDEGTGSAYGKTTTYIQTKSKSAFNNSTDDHNSTFIVFGD